LSIITTNVSELLQNAGKFGRKFDFCLEIGRKVGGWGERAGPFRPSLRSASSPARGGLAAGFPHFNKPCLSCYFVGLHGVFHSFNMVFHISTVERCRKPVQNVEKARRGGIFCGSFKVVSHVVHFLGACYNSYKR
jgi:hypothetical protein